MKNNYIVPAIEVIAINITTLTQESTLQMGGPTDDTKPNEAKMSDFLDFEEEEE